MAKPYYNVRFRWLNRADLDKLADEFREKYEVKILKIPGGDIDLAIYKDHRESLKVIADTLRALLAPTRAVIYQREAARLTVRDDEFRNRMKELYPRNTVTPFPWGFGEAIKI